MTDFKKGDKVWHLKHNDILFTTIRGVDVIDGIKRFWLDDSFGYFSKHDLYRTKNEVIDAMIKRLEAMKC